jgi:hypothetical protein
MKLFCQLDLLLVKKRATISDRYRLRGAGLQNLLKLFAWVIEGGSFSLSRRRIDQNSKEKIIY